MKTKEIRNQRGQKTTVKLSGWFAPYIKKGKSLRTTLRSVTKSKYGVYMIRRKGAKRPVYVGYSGSDLYKTMYRHFQSWDDKTQYRATYPKRGYEILVIVPRSRVLASAIEQYYIEKFKPRDAKRKLTLFPDEIDFAYMPRVEISAVEEVAPF